MLTNLVDDSARGDPLARDFGLRDQLQRAAVSVMNNVAEGWERLRPLEKRQAYNHARRCGEVRSMGYVLLDNKFISPTEHAQLATLCVQAGKLISGLILSLGKR